MCKLKYWHLFPKYSMMKTLTNIGQQKNQLREATKKLPPVVVRPQMPYPPFLFCVFFVFKASKKFIFLATPPPPLIGWTTSKGTFFLRLP